MRATLDSLAGTSLGARSVSYTERDVILYALSVGASATRLDLVYEADLRVLPTYALALGLWVVEAAGTLGAYDPITSLHASQSLQMRRPLPSTGTIDMQGNVQGVWDKGKAAIVDLGVQSEFFAATYSIFLPGQGGWQGPRGTSSARIEATSTRTWVRHTEIAANQAVLYRLTGDRHPLHVDPVVAEQAGFTRPILHGLCTLGIVAREVADATGVPPWSLNNLQARFAAPVYPGDTLTISARQDDGSRVTFETAVGPTAVIRDGLIEFTQHICQ